MGRYSKCLQKIALALVRVLDAVANAVHMFTLEQTKKEISNNLSTGSDRHTLEPKVTHSPETVEFQQSTAPAHVRPQTMTGMRRTQGYASGRTVLNPTMCVYHPNYGSGTIVGFDNSGHIDVVFDDFKCVLSVHVLDVYCLEAERPSGNG